MTLADETLEEWVKAAAAAEPFELPTIDELGSGTLRRIVETLLVAEQALIWAGSRVSQFVWNIGYALDLMVWEEDMPMEAREAAVRLMPSLLERACASGDSGAVHMFWENVVERHELATRNDQYHRMRDAVFEALLADSFKCLAGVAR